MEDFTIRKHIRSKDKGVNDYIESLENYILEKNASKTNELLMELDNLNGVIAEDINLISQGDIYDEVEEMKDGEMITSKVSKLKVMNDDKDSKIFDRVLALYGKVKDIKSVQEVVNSMLPEVEENENTGDVVEIKTNPFEDVLRRTKEKNSKK